VGELDSIPFLRKIDTWTDFDEIWHADAE